MRIEVNPLSAEVSAICIPSSRHGKLHLSRARKIKSRVYPRSLDRGQAAPFSKGDVIAARLLTFSKSRFFFSLP
jgi:hypothetical protein